MISRPTDMRFDITDELSFPVPPQAVFDTLLGGYTGTSRLQEPDLVVRPRAPTPRGEAGEVVDITAGGTFHFAARLEAVEPPRRLHTAYIEGDFVGEGTWTVEPIEGGCRVALRWRTRPGNLRTEAICAISDIAREHSTLVRRTLARVCWHLSPPQRRQSTSALHELPRSVLARAAGVVSGRLHSGHGFDRMGEGARPLVILQGLTPDLAPMGPLARMLLAGYGPPHGFWPVLINRRPGMPADASIADYAADHAAMLRAEFGGPVTVVGTSTGGSIALQLAIDHPDVVARLVVHSSAHRLGERGRMVQREAASLARAGDWRGVARVLLGLVAPARGPTRRLFDAFAPLGAGVLALASPEDARDLVTIVDAEDAFDCADRLGEIRAPTLVIGGEDDPAYTPALFRETATGIPGGRLVLLEGMGHPAAGTAFRRELAQFLRA